MKITFYQNCILSSRYNEVFWRDPTGTNNPLEEYLDTLTKYEQIIDSSYLPVPRGTFTIENPYKDGVDANLFNYIKVEYDEYENVRPFYAFIQNINLLYNQIVVSYLVDYWSSFSQYMHIRNSLLTNTNVLDFKNMKRDRINYYHYPVEYLTSEAPSIERYNYNKPNEIIFYLIAKIQFYNLDQSGKTTNRKVITCAILEDNTLSTFKGIDNRISEIIDIMITSSVGNNLTIDDKSYNYEIIDLYMLPEPIINNSILVNPFGKIKAKKTYALWHITVSNFTGELLKMNTFNIPITNFKVRSIGTIKTQIGIDIFGGNSTKQITTYVAISETSLNLFIGINGELIDITEDFKIDLPISVETADVTQLKNLTRIVNTQLNATKTTQQIASYSNQVEQGVVSLLNPFDNGGALGNIAEGTIGIATAAAEGAIKDQYINAKLYKSNSSVITNDNILLPCYYGICYFTVNNIDNEQEVIDAINLSGYKCAVNVDDILQVKPNNKFTNIKFAFVNLYGSFSQEIKEKLEQILVSGTRIYYTKEI